MQNGAFFAVTRILRGNDFEIGPKEGFDVRNTDLAYPMFTELSVDGHKITVTATDAEEIQFIANGKVISKQAIGSDAVVLDLDQIVGAADFEYVRVELKGQGGMCLSQALVIDDGSEPLKFEENATFAQKLVIAFKGTKLWTIIQEISYKIKK